MNYLIQQTQTFTAWHSSVRDLRAKIAIARRIDRAAAGNLGDVKPVGDGISELRVDVGAGYRVYSPCAVEWSSCYWRVVTSLHRVLISGERRNWPKRFEHEPTPDDI